MLVNINAMHIIILIAELATIILCSIVFRALIINSCYLRKECGNQIKAIIFISILSGISSIPYSLIVLGYGNISCPQLFFVLISSIRVVTTRFEITQYAMLAIDRAISTIFQKFYYKRIRKFSFRISLGVSGFLSAADLGFYIGRPQFGYNFIDCNYMESSGPFYNFEFFFLNILSWGIIICCYIIYIYDTRIHLRTSSLSTVVTIRLISAIIGFSILTLGIATVLHTINRLLPLKFLKNMGNYYDIFLHLQHILVFFVFCFAIDNKRLKQISITSTQTITSDNRQRINRSAPITPTPMDNHFPEQTGTQTGQQNQ